MQNMKRKFILKEQQQILYDMFKEVQRPRSVLLQEVFLKVFCTELRNKTLLKFSCAVIFAKVACTFFKTIQFVLVYHQAINFDETGSPHRFKIIPKIGNYKKLMNASYKYLISHSHSFVVSMAASQLVAMEILHISSAKFTLWRYSPHQTI